MLLSYVNVKIAELDGRKQELLARIAELAVEAISPEQVNQISGYLDTWENVSFDDKPFSYTHLDVYKRQHSTSTIINPLEVRKPDGI